MDRRWAPAGAAIAVVAVVAAVALVLGGDDEPGRVATLAAPSTPPSAPASASAEPSPPEDVPASPPSAPAPRPAPSTADPGTADPDTPVSSDDEPSPAPAAPPPTKRTAPPPAPPTTAAPKPSAGVDRSAFSFDAAYGTDEPYEVVVQYGDSSSCPHANVRHAVRESADRVVVTLEADAMDSARACTADYRQRLVPVRLQQPLGDRVLVDGSRNEQVAVDRSCNRPFGNPPPPEDCAP